MIVIGSVILGLFVCLDVARRLSPACNQLFMKTLFKPIARPSEAHKVPSATWYMTSLLIGVIAFPQHAIALAALVLAVGDPAASLAGKKWGRLKLIGSKSWVGTGAFILAATIVCTIFLSLVLPGLAFGHRLGIAAALAAAGAVTELLSGRIDDNLSIPLVTGLLATLLL
jgi:dolichol kinase